jgi:hypothetical protein
MRDSIVTGVFVLFGMEALAEDETPLTEVSSQKLRLNSSSSIPFFIGNGGSASHNSRHKPFPSAVGGTLDIQLNRRLTLRPIQTDYLLTHLIIENSTQRFLAFSQNNFIMVPASSSALAVCSNLDSSLQ